LCLLPIRKAIPLRDAAFHAFFEQHYAGLSGLAYLMTGESSVADDLASDALTEVWQHWDRVAAAGDSAAYARGIVANLTRRWIRRQGLARRSLRLLAPSGSDQVRSQPDVPAVLDVRSALARLPHRRRACVVLRYPAVRGHPGDTQVEKGSLWSDGSAGAARQSTVTLKAGADITELDLTIRVAMTPGLADQGATDDVATAGITATVEHRSDALLYHFVLGAGATLSAGTYAFTARYGQDGATRDAGDDTYEAFGYDVNRKRLHVYGNFAAKAK